MFSPSELAAEISVLVETFIIRWNIDRDVANKLLRSPPEMQWKVISNQVPRYVHNPNGFVLNRIVKATNRCLDLPPSGEGIGQADLQPDEPSAKTGYANRSRSRPRIVSQAFYRKHKFSEVVEVSDSFPPLPERSPT